MQTIFISWSGRQGRKLAEALKETVLDPKVFNAWVSSQDITIGSTWFSSLNLQLKQADGALVCVTKEAVHSPWVNFEIGGLFARLSNVKVLLFGVEVKELNETPLSQIQLAQGTNKQDLLRVLSELCVPEDRDDTRHHLERTWEEWLLRCRRITEPWTQEEGINTDVSSLSQILLTSIQAQSQQYRDFSFRLHSIIGTQQLNRVKLPFDIAMNGVLRFRSDTPELARSLYYTSLLLKIVPEALTSIHVGQARAGAERILSFGFGEEVDDDPWDTHIYLFGLSLDDSIESIAHKPYRNVFLISADGHFRNTTPHKWVDSVLKRVLLLWKPQNIGK